MERSRQSAPVVSILRIAEQSVDIVPLERATAVDVASTLRELLELSRRVVRNRGCAFPHLGQEDAMHSGALEPKSPQPRIVAIPQSNSLLVTATSESERSALLELIARLDKATDRPR